MQKSTGLSVLICFLSIAIFCSCGNVRQLQYLQGQFDTAKLSQIKYPEPLIQKNELISITVYSDDPRASAYYNLPAQTTVNNTGTITSPATQMTTPTSTYLVDEAGGIQMPGLGRIEVAGLTKAQLDSMLVSRLKDKLNNPYVIIRLSSYKITMIGEVGKPGQFAIPNERVSLLEALALAGDLTAFGRRDNIRVIREINGQRTFATVDLRNPEILNSPYFYLYPNDVVLVDVNKTKAATNDQVAVRNISLATSIISVLALVITVLR